MADDLSARVQRLEESESRAWAAIERLADKQNQLDDALTTMADAQTKLYESQQLLQHQMAEQSRQTDERITALVRAIGEFIRNRNGGTH